MLCAPSSSVTALLLPVQLCDQFVDAPSLLEGGVLLEFQLGKEFQPDLPADRTPQVWGGRCKRRAGARPRLLVPVARVEDPRAAQVPRHLDAGHGDEADPGILQPLDLLGEDLAELLADALGASSLRHVTPPTRGV